MWKTRSTSTLGAIQNPSRRNTRVMQSTRDIIPKSSIKAASSNITRGKKCEPSTMKFPGHYPILVTKGNSEVNKSTPNKAVNKKISNSERTYSALGSPKFNIETSKQNSSIFDGCKTGVGRGDVYGRLRDIIVGLDLTECVGILIENKINYEDLLLLTKEDMKEIGLPIYARNRIIAFQEYLKRGKSMSLESKDLLQDILRSIYNPVFVELINDNNIHSTYNFNDPVTQSKENLPIREQGANSSTTNLKRNKIEEIPEVKYMPSYIQKHSNKHKESLNKYKAELDTMLANMYKR